MRLLDRPACYSGECYYCVVDARFTLPTPHQAMVGGAMMGREQFCVSWPTGGLMMTTSTPFLNNDTPSHQSMPMAKM